MNVGDLCVVKMRVSIKKVFMILFFEKDFDIILIKEIIEFV